MIRTKEIVKEKSNQQISHFQQENSLFKKNIFASTKKQKLQAWEKKNVNDTLNVTCAIAPKLLIYTWHT